MFDKSARIFEEVYERINEEKPVDVISLEFAKAFDNLIEYWRNNYKQVWLEGRYLLEFKAGYQVEDKSGHQWQTL